MIAQSERNKIKRYTTKDGSLIREGQYQAEFSGGTYPSRFHDLAPQTS